MATLDRPKTEISRVYVSLREHPGNNGTGNRSFTIYDTTVIEVEALIRDAVEATDGADPVDNPTPAPA